MKPRTLLLLAILLFLIALLPRLREEVTSTIRFEGPPTWEGKIGDVVELGGSQWAWTETPTSRGWVRVQYLEW